MIFFSIAQNWENKLLIGQKIFFYQQEICFISSDIKNHTKYYIKFNIQTLSYPKIDWWYGKEKKITNFFELNYICTQFTINYDVPVHIVVDIV